MIPPQVEEAVCIDVVDHRRVVGPFLHLPLVDHGHALCQRRFGLDLDIAVAA